MCSVYCTCKALRTALFRQFDTSLDEGPVLVTVDTEGTRRSVEYCILYMNLKGVENCTVPSIRLWMKVKPWSQYTLKGLGDLSCTVYCTCKALRTALFRQYISG